MSLKQLLLNAYFLRFYKNSPTRNQQIEEQNRIFKSLMKGFEMTKIGKDLGIHQKTNTQDFLKIPVHMYDDLEVYIDQISMGESHVLTGEKVLCFVKTSGTSSKSKYIPMTKKALQNHMNGPKRYLSNIVKNIPTNDLFKYKTLIFSDTHQGTKYGIYSAESLSACLSSNVNGWMDHFVIPGQKTQTESNLNVKIKKIAEECKNQKISFVVAMPSWFNALLSEMNPEDIKYCFQSLSLVSFSGMDPHPYLQPIEDKLGFKFKWMQSYPASEGFFAYGESLYDEDMLLITDQHIYYEFIPYESHIAVQTKKKIDDVELGVKYQMIITAANGLLSYQIGDLVEFTSLDPYKVKVAGRIGDQISVTGELIHADQINKAVQHAIKRVLNVDADLFFAVYPEFDQIGRPYYQWIVESNMSYETGIRWVSEIDQFLRNQNQNYDDNRNGNILLPPQLHLIENGTLERLFLTHKMLGIQSKIKKVYSKKPDFLYGIEKFTKIK